MLIYYLCYVLFVLLVGAIALLIASRIDNRRLRQSLIEHQQKITDLKWNNQILCSGSRMITDISETSGSTPTDLYDEYRKNGGTLDKLSWLLAEDDHLRHPIRPKP